MGRYAQWPLTLQEMNGERKTCRLLKFRKMQNAMFGLALGSTITLKNLEVREKKREQGDEMLNRWPIIRWDGPAWPAGLGELFP
jgi:hypothetical protein